MITNIPDRERTLQAEVDALTAELARLRAQEPVAMVFQHGATVRLDWASVKAAHNCKPGPLYAAPPAQPAEPVQRLSDEQIDAVTRDKFGTSLLGAEIAMHREYGRAIESALQPGWLPIESAPKDDETVWLHCDGKVLRGFWCQIDFKEYRDADGNYIGQLDQDSYWMSCADGDEVEPDAWMPIVTPLPPKATK